MPKFNEANSNFKFQTPKNIFRRRFVIHYVLHNSQLKERMEFAEVGRLTRGDSLDSLPDAEFLCPNHIMKLLDQPSASEFKKMEASGKLRPEPLLLEDKSRFVLFPIKHTDVIFVMHHCGCAAYDVFYRFGICIRKQRLPSGLLKNLIYQLTTRIGRT